MKSRSQIMLILVFMSAALSNIHANGDDETILARWRLRRSVLNQFRCEYSLVETKFPTPEERRKREYRSPDGTVVIRPGEDPLVHDGVFLFDSQRIRLTIQNPQPGFTRDPRRQISRITSIYTPEKFQSLTESFRKTPPLGQIEPAQHLPHNLYLDVALGLRLWGDRNSLSDERIREARIEEIGEGQVKVNFPGKNGTLHSAGISLRDGFDILSWNLYDAEHNKRIEIIASGYTDAGPLSVPHLIEATTFRPDGSLMVRTEMKIKRLEVGRDSLKDETFRMEWPPETVSILGFPLKK